MFNNKKKKVFVVIETCVKNRYDKISLEVMSIKLIRLINSIN